MDYQYILSMSVSKLAPEHVKKLQAGKRTAEVPEIIEAKKPVASPISYTQKPEALMHAHR